ncbi:S-adenosyl-L-methionine-dependent methyltransferase [Clohesyomyces aquaticus]|uniref:DNA (cytosine-5-)-methyltransferase n=1 Tax=Clohesyomyces aquaticus TaxID=1231657 RepID=A0A1Y1ZQ10_9PLEO|nr:S-adenosyl-L-methionine-dependent methyltransferase [Clohesyomyces aquaticus]
MRNGPIRLPDVELDVYRLENGEILNPGDTVELKDPSKAHYEGLHSGSFLRIKFIIRNLETDEVTLRGYLLCRTKYHGQIFDWKLNELVMVLNVTEDDHRDAFVQGMENFSINDVLRKRECIVTHLSYPAMTFREGPLPIHLQTDEERKAWVFRRGRLTCRWLNIAIYTASRKNYAGVVRAIYSGESDGRKLPGGLRDEGRKPEMPIDLDGDNRGHSKGLFNAKGAQKRHRPSKSLEEIGGVDDLKVARQEKKHKKSDSVEEVDPTGQPSLPTKTTRYSFGDVFCGAGGASQGASTAGLHVKWGLDKDEYAMLAYGANFPGATTFNMDAHDFPHPAVPKNFLKVDILHLSTPCCYWSPAHTCAGQNDQANFEAIYTVGPIIEKLKPRVATLEQTFGLLTHTEHKKNFRQLMNDIGKAGYDIRYKIQDMSEFGLPQRRKRLLIIAARRGTPLPPFPRPTHGPAGSGLKRCTSVYQALEPIRRLTRRSEYDEYHRPDDMKPIDKPAYDPTTSFLKGCITTGGGDNHHYLGNRRYTAREMSLFQSFPYEYVFTGSHCEALKQIGNAFPPIMASALYKSIAKTLEAYDNGIIGPEDDIADLDAFLRDRNIAVQPSAPSSSGRSLFERASLPSVPSSPYRYLTTASASRPSSRTSTPIRAGNSSTQTRAGNSGTPARNASTRARRTDIEPTQDRPQPRSGSSSIWGLWARAGNIERSREPAHEQAHEREHTPHQSRMTLPVRPKRNMTDRERAEQAEADGEIVILD